MKEIEKLTAEDLMFAVYTYNADPAIVENIEDAEMLLASIKENGLQELDGDDKIDAEEKLDFLPGFTRRAYSFRIGYVVFSEDYGD